MPQQLNPLEAAKSNNGTQQQAQDVYPVPANLMQAVVQILARQPWAEVHQVLAALQALAPMGK